MPDIHLDAELVEYNLNDKCQVAFNPTDPFFMNRLYDTVDSLDKCQDKYISAASTNGDLAAFFTQAKEIDKEMRALIDGFFGKPVCEPLFGESSLCAFSNGLPLWCNLTFALIDEVNTGFTREAKLTNPRLAKYTAKYKKRQ